MNVTRLIDCISTTDGVGRILIKPITGLRKDLSDLYGTDIWESESILERKTGTVKFGDSSWEAQNSKSEPIIPLSGESEIAFQIRAYGLLKTLVGDCEGGIGVKFSTAQGNVSRMNQLGRFALKKGYESFHQLNSEPPLRIRTAAYDFYTDDIDAGNVYPSDQWLDSIFKADKLYGLLSEAVCNIFHEVGIDFRKRFHKDRKPAISHPVIPTRILRHLVKWASSVVDEAINNIDDLEKVNSSIMGHLVRPKVNHKDAPLETDVSYFVLNRIRSNLDKKMVEDVFDKFRDLKRATFILILASTGMRLEEALELKVDSANEVDGSYSVVSLMTKTDDTQVELPWVANKDVYRAVNVLSRFVHCGMERAKTLIKHNSTAVKASNLHNLTVGVSDNKLFSLRHGPVPNFADAGNFITFESGAHRKAFHLYDIKVTSSDIEQLNRTDSNSKSTQGKNRGVPYEVGDTFNISAHMFRHTFAWFIMANRLGDLDDIKYQFNHLSAAMSMVYANRGIASTDEIITIFEAFEELLTNKVASEISEQASNGTLGGGGGERFNKVAKTMVIGITDTNSDNPTEIRQIHFSSLEEFELFLQKNMRNLRGLPHGYCSGAEACKINNAAVPTGCVYCGSYTVIERQMVHWAAMKKHALGKLAMYTELSEELQRRYELLATQWRDSVSAADRVMGNLNQSVANVREEALA